MSLQVSKSTTTSPSEGVLINWCQPVPPMSEEDVQKLRVHLGSGPIPTQAKVIAWTDEEVPRATRVRVEAMSTVHGASTSLSLMADPAIALWGKAKIHPHSEQIFKRGIYFKYRAPGGELQSTRIDATKKEEIQRRVVTIDGTKHGVCQPEFGGFWSQIRQLADRPVYSHEFLWNNHEGKNPSPDIRVVEAFLEIPGDVQAFTSHQLTYALESVYVEDEDVTRVYLTQNGKTEVLPQTHRLTRQLWYALRTEDNRHVDVAEQCSDSEGWGRPAGDSLWSDFRPSKIASRHASGIPLPRMSKFTKNSPDFFKDRIWNRLFGWESIVVDPLASFPGSQGGSLGWCKVKGSKYGGNTGGYGLGTDECLEEYLAGTPEAARLLMLRRWVEQGRGVGDVYLNGVPCDLGPLGDPNPDLPEEWKKSLREGKNGYNYEIYGTYDDEKRGRGWLGGRDPFGHTQVPLHLATDKEAAPYEAELIQWDPDDQQHAARRDQELTACAAMLGSDLDILLLEASARGYVISYHHGADDNFYTASIGYLLQEALASPGRGAASSREDAWMQSCIAEAAMRVHPSKKTSFIENGEAWCTMLRAAQTPAGNVEAKVEYEKLSRERSQDIIAWNEKNPDDQKRWRPVCQNWTNDLHLWGMSSWNWVRGMREENEKAVSLFVNTLAFWWDPRVENQVTNGAIREGADSPIDHSHVLDGPAEGHSSSHDDYYHAVRLAMPINSRQDFLLPSMLTSAYFLHRWCKGLPLQDRLASRSLDAHLSFDWMLWLIAEQHSPEVLELIAEISSGVLKLPSKAIYF